MSDYNQHDEDTEIEAEIQRELDALNLEDDEEESDNQAGSEEYQHDEDTDTDVIQELAEEDEEDSKPLPIDGPGVKVLALEGPLFEEQNEDSIDGPLPALEGPPTDEDGQLEGKEVVVAGEKGLQVYTEPVQQFEGAARKKVKEFEDRYETQLQEYRKDYEESQRLRVRREKQSEEDRARRRRENDEEQRQLAQERMMYQSQIQEKLDELDKNTKESLENYQNEIKKLEARTSKERKEFEEQFLQHQQQIAEKRCMAATKIQAVFRSYRARKPFLKKMRIIKEEVRKKMIDKRQMEIAAQKKQEEQKKRKEKEEKKRKEEEMRRKMEEERRKQEEDEKLKRERLEKERLEKERREREVMEMRRAEEERKEKEQREMEEKANEILAKIMKEKQSNNLEENDSHTVGDGSLVQPAVKVNIINSQDMNIHYANEGSQIKDVDKSVLDDEVKSGNVEEEREEGEIHGEISMEKKALEEVRVKMQNDYLGEEIVGEEDGRKGRENLLESQTTDTEHRQFVGKDSRDGIVNLELTIGDQWKGEEVEDDQTKFVDTGGSGKVEDASAIENLSLNVNVKNGKVVGESAQMKEKTKVKPGVRKELQKDENFPKSPGAENDVQFKNSNSETKMDQESSRSNKLFELNAKTTKVTEVEEKDVKGTFDGGNSEKVTNMEDSTNSKILYEQDETEREKSLKCEDEEAKRECENKDAMVTSTYAPAKHDVGHGSDSSCGGSKESLNEEYQRARLEWMKKSIPFSKKLIQAKDHLREQEKKKRRYLRRPSAVKKMTEISEEQLLTASPMVNTLAEGNQLASVSCRDRTMLTFLDLSNNNLSTIQGLEGCTSLKWLNLSHNRITRLSSESKNILKKEGNTVPDFSNHVLLTELFLDNNSLVAMETMELSWLPRLHCLSLSQNSLQTVPVLMYAPLLKKLDIRNNYITDISSLSDGLSCLPSLERLHIDGNPVTEESDCRAEIFKLVPSLQYLEDGAVPSSDSQRPHSRFEEMCLSQITAEDALKRRHSELIQSLERDDKYLENVASTWSAYLDFWLKMVIDHRYMHEYGDLSIVTCEVKDLCRMIPEPDSKRRGTSSEEKEKYPVKKGNVDGIMSHLKDTNKNTTHLKTGGKSAMKQLESGQSLKKNGSESRVDGTNKNSLPPSLPKAIDVKNEVYSSDKSWQNEAATRIQALWRGFEVRRDLELHSKQYLAAVLIQSIWRGHRVRQRYLKARAALQNQKSEEQEEEEFDFNEDLDLEFLEFSEENLEKGWLPSEIPEVPSSHPVLPPKHNSKSSPLQERPVSSISTSMSPSPEKFAPHPPKQAWRGTNSPLAPIGNHVSVPKDKTILHGKPPLPPVTPSSSRTESEVSSTARTVRSKKEQELSEEWGFKDNITAELMMKRAKKMNQSRKKKNLAKEEAAEQKTKEIHQRTYEWVHSQTAYPDDESILVDSNQSFRSRHSSSEPSLPRMSPDVLQGRVHLTASPTIDLQSVDGSSINGVAVRGRSNSFSSPDGERLPPIKTNSAPTSHIRQRQAAKVPPSHEGAYNTRQAWGRSPKGKRR
ncbi:Leucine-rich repeat and IQ domain-containing protein 1 [Holothuria leucospilota]|uniref:Leucine-rich repeat and IQ domain-containing protein 1 n=1 Tax=Holothuria leucospilota TaxID=206669 RepID=A0A9Q0YK43_HOLLE|nr:Leucine-rich repeat and IQ domain-containing protein 1 [Holothuria leucospilota]